jgi:hypothetical protein
MNYFLFFFIISYSFFIISYSFFILCLFFFILLYLREGGGVILEVPFLGKAFLI